MGLRFHNTLTRRLEDFVPLRAGEAGVYSCGPTVYSFAHIGNFRAYLFEDVLCRLLRVRGLRVRQVMNITDVDDKTIRGAGREGKDLRAFTRPFIKAFREDLRTLGIVPADAYPRATDYVPQMIRLIRTLLDKGLAYEADGSVYYRISAFPGYGALSRMDFDQVRPAGRTDRDEYAKETAHDFCLWKAAREGEPSWAAPFGPGRPGWHVECSAMSMHHLGETFDIHTGGEDNIFPHHENEIAQSEGATGRPFVRFWLHCKFLVVNGEKMSKSKGNWYTLRDLTERGHSPAAIRMSLLSAHYRSVLNFTLEGLEQARRTLQHLQGFVERLDAHRSLKDRSGLVSVEPFRERFHRALDEDLDVPGALAAFFDAVSEVNKAMSEKRLGPRDRETMRLFLEEVDDVLGIVPRAGTGGVDADVRRLVKEREAARKGRDFKKADALRDEILKHGYLLEDTPKGPHVRKRL